MLASVSEDDLVALHDDPRVLAIVPNELMSPHMLEGNAMINQPVAIASGHDGTGAVVAVIDTGVDFTHAALAGAVETEHCFSLGTGPGSRGCPNGTAEQHGDGAAADYGVHDGGHGTAVASIIASRGGGGVAAGVAPGAKIVAYRVGSPLQPGFWSSDVLAALDHINSSQVGVVDIVNMSLGSSTQHTTVASCETAGGPTGSGGSGRKAVTDSLFGTHGILVVASSGNFGHVDRMSEPACLPSVMSVGAVMDVAVTLSTSVCSATYTAGQVACYSNSASFLDVLAPSHCALTARATALGGGTTNACFGGTSAAAPYVAGAAALLMGTSSGLAAQATWDKLVNTGTATPDWRVGGPTKPLINLLEAFAIDLTITVGADKTHQTVQAALDAATLPGNVIEVDAGTYTENLVVPADRSITIVGMGALPGGTVLQGFATSGLATVVIPEGSTVTLRNLTVTGGEASGIRNAGIVTLDNVIVEGNTATVAPDPDENVLHGGGGLRNLGTATALVTGSTIRLNTVTGGPSMANGGGIENAGTLTVTDSIIEDNTAVNVGGGIHNWISGTLLVNGTTRVQRNTAAFGGGIFNAGFTQADGASGSATISGAGVVIDDNTATDDGGGIYNQGGLTITGATVSGNAAGFGGANADAAGGGIANVRPASAFPSQAVLTMTGVTLIANTAPHGGGLDLRGTTTLSGGGVIDNDATHADDGLGGGIYQRLGTTTVSGGTLIQDNTAPTGNGGGIALTVGTFTATDITLTANTAVLGGAVFVREATLRLTDATVSNSVSDVASAAIHNLGGDASIYSAAFTGNGGGAPPAGGDVLAADLLDVDDTVLKAAVTKIRASAFSLFDGTRLFTVRSLNNPGGPATNAIDARFNWWGSPDAPTADGTFTGFALVGLILFEPQCLVEECTPAALQVTIAGGGTGTITLTDFSAEVSALLLDCTTVAGVCTSDAFPPGDEVALNATATGGSTFAGWAGACDASGVVFIPLASDGEATVLCTASFAAPAPPPPVGGGGGGGGGAPPVATPTPTPTATPVTESGGVTVEVTERTTTPTPTNSTATLETASNGSTARVTVPPSAIPGAAEVSLGVIANLDSLIQQAPLNGINGIVLAFQVQATNSAGGAITANFNEPVNLEFVVPLSSLPPTISAQDMTVAFWSGTAWVEVPATITINGDGTVTLTASVNHFTIVSVAYRPGVRAFAQPLRPAAATFTVWGGGTVAEATNASPGQIISIWIFVDGRFRGYTVGAVPFVNASFRAVFPGDYIPANTPMVVVTR